MKIDNMREIKFRVWDKINKTFVNDYFIRNNTIRPLALNLNSGLLATSFYKESQRMGDLGHGIETISNQEDFIIQQFTGLLDKNGREIYEGDICKRKNWENVYYVRYSKDGYFWCGTHENDEQFYEYRDCLYDSDRLRNGIEECEVIGNIFENSELIK